MVYLKKNIYIELDWPQFLKLIFFCVTIYSILVASLSFALETSENVEICQRGNVSMFTDFHH